VNVLDRHANPRATVPRRSLRGMRPDQLERRLRERLDELGPAPRAELLHVLMLPDFDRADRIGEFWGYPQSRTFAELLIDCEEDRTLQRCWSGCCERRIGDAEGAPRARAARRACRLNAHKGKNRGRRLEPS
jgi:hypothetical protein